MRSFTFTLRASCRKCGDPLPVNGPLRSTVCDSCYCNNKLTPSVWASQIAAADEGMRIFNNPYICMPEETRNLHCPSCEKSFRADYDLIGKDSFQSCPHCGTEIPTFPAPPYMKKAMPRAVQVFSTERDDEGKGKPAASVAADESSSRPIIFACPSCGAALKIGMETKRFVPCAHCDGEVYIPDLIWKRLHPVRVMQPWTIVYEGRGHLTAADD